MVESFETCVESNEFVAFESLESNIESPKFLAFAEFKLDLRLRCSLSLSYWIQRNL